MKKVLALVLALCMTLCVAQAAMADMLSDIQEKGTLVVGANVGFPPYEFYYTNPETGEEELQGFDMKLAQAIADELGVEDYFWQEGGAAEESFIPAFDFAGV